jgi:signal transduction histidine kinase
LFYTKNFENDYSDLIGLLSACARLHSDPMIYTDLSGKLVGCNEALMDLLALKEFEEIAPLQDWFAPHGVELSYLLSQSGDYRGKIDTAGSGYDVSVKSEVILLDHHPIIGVVFRDISIIERARAAERYFEQFKKKFLTTISHEFRTP